MQFPEAPMAKRPAMTLSPVERHPHFGVLKSVLVRIEFRENLKMHAGLSRVLAESE
jgi:hypothetical protein